MEVYKEIDGTSRRVDLVPTMPGSDSTNNCFYDGRPIIVSQEQFDALLEEDSKERKDLVRDILASNK